MLSTQVSVSRQLVNVINIIDDCVSPFKDLCYNSYNKLQLFQKIETSAIFWIHDDLEFKGSIKCFFKNYLSKLGYYRSGRAKDSFSILMVCDCNTFRALGKRIQYYLSTQDGCISSNLRLTHLILDESTSQIDEANNEISINKDRVKPSITNVNFIVDCAIENQIDLLISVGSGTINDLVKYAAYLLCISFITFPTAPSVNGYTSSNASIIQDGMKQSFTCCLPDAIFLDLFTIHNCPMRLIRSGFADAMARQTAQVDWLISHEYTQSEYSHLICQAGINSENYIVRHYTDLGIDIGFTKALMKNLLVSGFGMYFAGGSYPASGSEHQIAHCLEYEFPSVTCHYLHGEMIAQTLPLAISLQSQMRLDLTSQIHNNQSMKIIFNDLNSIDYLQQYNITSDQELFKFLIRSKTIRDRYSVLNLITKNDDVNCADLLRMID